MLDYTTAVNEFESLEQRLLKTVSERPIRDMSDEKCRREVRDIFIKSQGFDKIPVPEIKYQCVSEELRFNCRIQRLAGTSWDDCATAAHLFLPLTPGPWPVVLVACGHGENKLGYGKAGIILAQRGIACLIPDNIGQLERLPMGHWLETAPFACGFSFAALLTTELLANLKWLKQDGRFTKIGAAGNSGGGTLTMSLAALAPDYLDAILSSGYPSSFEWICRKRKRHCACNLFPGVLGKIEHCDLYSLFAPKPLKLMQGNLDNLIPLDIFHSTAGIIKRAYRQMGREENFSTAVWQNTHPWCDESRTLIAAFFAEVFNVPDDAAAPDDSILSVTDDTVLGKVYDKFPAWAVDTKELAYRIAGIKNQDSVPKLEDIWKCEHVQKYPQLYPAGDTERIMAQWRCFTDGFK